MNTFEQVTVEIDGIIVGTEGKTTTLKTAVAGVIYLPDTGCTVVEKDVRLTITCPRNFAISLGLEEYILSGAPDKVDEPA